MNGMTYEQWGRMLAALGQVPMVDVAMSLSSRDAQTLYWLALKGLEWELTNRIPRFGEGDQQDALELAYLLNIDPATGQHIPPSQAIDPEPQSAARGEIVYIDDLLDAITTGD